MATSNSSLPSANHTFVDMSFDGHLRKGLFALQQDDHLTDVTLKCEGAVMRCHRVVLAASSSYFRAMFTSGLQETTSSTIEISQIDSAALQSIVRYIYSSRIDITAANVQDIAVAADMLDFPQIGTACENFMLAQDIGSANCLGFHRFAKHLQMQKLEQKAREVVMRKFPAVVRSAEFKDISDNEMIDYISDSNLCVSDEDVVFDAVKKWMGCDLPSRSAHLERVLAHVRMPFCSSAYLLKLSEYGAANQRPYQTDRIKGFVQEALMFHMSPAHQHTICSPRTEPRKSFSIERRLIVLGGSEKNVVNDTCWYSTGEAGESYWKNLTNLPPDQLQFYSCCVVERGILLTGGCDDEHILEDCWLYDMAANKWENTATLVTARYDHQAVAHCGRAYILGGQDCTNRCLSSVECLDMKTEIVTEKNSMIKALSEPLAVSFGLNLYVFGGSKDDAELFSTSTQECDTVWETWTLKAEMPKVCMQGAATVVNDRVFIVGGLTRVCMSYTPASDSWTLLATPRCAHGKAPAVVWKGKILVAGGEELKTEECSALIEQYDVDEDKWSTFEHSLEVDLSGHHLLNLNFPKRVTQ